MMDSDETKFTDDIYDAAKKGNLKNDNDYTDDDDSDDIDGNNSYSCNKKRRKFTKKSHKNDDSTRDEKSIVVVEVDYTPHHRANSKAYTTRFAREQNIVSQHTNVQTQYDDDEDDQVVIQLPSTTDDDTTDTWELSMSLRKPPPS